VSGPPAVAVGAQEGEAVLAVAELYVRFATPEGTVQAVNGVSLTVAAAETVGVVGESGCGKSQLFLGVLGLLAGNGQVSGSARYRGRELLGLTRGELDQIRGRRLAMIFQDAMAALNPYLTIGRQLAEVLVCHLGLSGADARRRAIAVLDRVRIPEARRRYHCYPHEFSGGMRQRVMIAMALLCQPELLIADEPTTALDVTVQAQILSLLRELRQESQASIVLITHDLGVVAGLCERVLVMYAGRVVETGAVQDIFYRPQHPYTRGLLASSPRPDTRQRPRLQAIPGQPPNLQQLPPGCAFAARCAYAFARCRQQQPPLRPVGSPGHLKACHLDRL
jgi:oligopeptide transport system ATP-binding protein